VTKLMMGQIVVWLLQPMTGLVILPQGCDLEDYSFKDLASLTKSELTRGDGELLQLWKEASPRSSICVG